MTTHLAAWINRKGVYFPRAKPDPFEGVPQAVRWKESPEGQHIELGIAEHNLFLALGALGQTHELSGLTLFPIGTLYDPFVNRGLDALYHALYAGGKFIVAATPSGLFADSIRKPNDTLNVTARVEHSLTKTQMLRAEAQRNHVRLQNLGVGDFDLPERGYGQTRDEQILRGSLAGSIRPGLKLSCVEAPEPTTVVGVVESPPGRSMNDTPRSVRKRKTWRMFPPGSPPSWSSTGLM